MQLPWREQSGMGYLAGQSHRSWLPWWGRGRGPDRAAPPPVPSLLVSALKWQSIPPSGPPQTMGISQRDVAAGLGPATGKEAMSGPSLQFPPQVRPEGTHV